MSMNLNLALFAGNMTRDPETRQVGSDSVVAFTLAQNRKYKTKSGEEREDTVFIDCEAWGKTGEPLTKYAKKGKGIVVEATMRQQSWQDKDGNKRSKIMLRVERFHFLGDGKKSDNPDRDPGGISRDSETDDRRPTPAAADDAPPF